MLSAYLPTNALPPPRSQGFYVTPSFSGPELVHRRIDWTSRPTGLPSVAFIYASDIGPQRAPMRHLHVQEGGTGRGLANLLELVQAFEGVAEALATEAWKPSEGQHARLLAYLARVRLIHTLTGRYYSDKITQIRNHDYLTRLAFEALDPIDCRVGFAEGFLEAGRREQAVRLTSDKGRHTLNGRLLSSVSRLVRSCTGGKVQTVLDTGPELHVFYESHARSRKELQTELRAALNDIQGCAEGKDLYAFTARPPGSAVGTAGHVSSRAYRNELVTAWLQPPSLAGAASPHDPATLWLAVALTRWMCDDTVGAQVPATRGPPAPRSAPRWEGPT